MIALSVFSRYLYNHDNYEQEIAGYYYGVKGETRERREHYS